jgi:hypothetical protein
MTLKCGFVLRNFGHDMQHTFPLLLPGPKLSEICHSFRRIRARALRAWCVTVTLLSFLRAAEPAKARVWRTPATFIAGVAPSPRFSPPMLTLPAVYCPSNAVQLFIQAPQRRQDQCYSLWSTQRAMCGAWDKVFTLRVMPTTDRPTHGVLALLLPSLPGQKVSASRWPASDVAGT